MEDVDRELSEAKLSLNARARIVAESYLSTVRPNSPSSNYKLHADSSLKSSLHKPSHNKQDGKVVGTPMTRYPLLLC